MNKIDSKLQLREMQDICTLACEKFAAGDKVLTITITVGEKVILDLIRQGNVRANVILPSLPCATNP